MNTFIITSFILNFVHKCVILVKIREDIMASMNPVKNRKNYCVQYKNPYTHKWQKSYFRNKNDAALALNHWRQVELYIKNGWDWESLLHQQKTPITIDQIFTAFNNNVLSTMTNIDTIARYRAVMQSCKKVFPGNTSSNEIRTMNRIINGTKVSGWMIYKLEMELIYGRTRRGIDSYLRDLLHIFNWAFDEELIHKVVIKKSDRYKKHELAPINYKVWSKEEIQYVFNHNKLSQYHKDILLLFAMTGARANEIVGHNKRKPYKELHWEHIDMRENKIQLLQKRRQIRETVDIHPNVMSILKKWFRSGSDRPLDMTYKELNSVIKKINNIVGINFTCHDLRRMKAQLVRKETKDASKAGHSIGDKSTEVVDNHYAGVTLEEQQAINNSAFDALNKIIKQ